MNVPCWSLLLFREDICQTEEKFKGTVPPTMEKLLRNPGEVAEGLFFFFDELKPHCSRTLRF